MYRFSEPFRPVISMVDLASIWESRSNLVGGGLWTNKCQKLMFEQYGFEDVILTSSCTDALEIAFTLADLKPTDNVVVPGFTFVSSVLPAVNFTNDITFCDVALNTGNASCADIESVIKENTKVVVVVNYGGINHDLFKIKDICESKGIVLIEDAAQSIGARMEKRWFGSFGDLSTFSFHDTKNINSGGEGGCLVINNKKYVHRAHILSEKGTNRRDFLDNVVNKYEWLDKGSSHIMSDLNAFILYHGLLNESSVTSHRASLFYRYRENLNHEGFQFGPIVQDGSQVNGHLAFVLLESQNDRMEFQAYMQAHGVQTALHYPNLARSPFSQNNFRKFILPNCDSLESKLCRVPIHYYMSIEDVDKISQIIEDWLMRKVK
jgi:dTDP-4-amino-4,6-dideoxygalactose transaminase